MDRGVWQATVQRITKSQTQLSDLATVHTHIYTYFTCIISVILPAISQDILFYQKDIEVREFGMDRNTLLYLKWITNTDLLYSTWNSAQSYVAAWVGGGFRKEWICIYIWLSLFTVHLKLSQHS